VPGGERCGCLGKVMAPLIPGEERGVGTEVDDGESSGVRMGIGRAFLGCGERIAGEEVMVRGSLGASDKLGIGSFAATRVVLDVFRDSEMLGI